MNYVRQWRQEEEVTSGLSKNLLKMETKLYFKLLSTEM